MIILGLALEIRDPCKNEIPVFQDEGAALIVNGTTVSRIDAPKLRKMKRNTGPLSTVRFVLKDYGIQLKEVDKIALPGTEEDSAITLNQKDNLCTWFHQVFDVTPDRSDIFFINPHLVYAAAMFNIPSNDRCIFLTFHQGSGGSSLMLLGGAGNHHNLDELDFFPAVDREKFPWEEVVERLSNHGKDFPHLKLCITSNTALPSSLQERIRSAGIFLDIFTNPVKHASTQALGAGLYLYYKETSTCAPQQPQVKYEAYRDETGRILTQIWQKILAKEKIGINDNFFHQGGNSLTAFVLENEIHKTFHKNISLADIFKHPTIKELSTCLRVLPQDNYAAIEPVEKKEYYPLTSAQKRLYIIQQMELDSTGYNLPQIFPLANVSDIDKLEKVFSKLVKRHESFRTSFHMINNEPAQRIHDDVEFKVSYYEPGNNVQGVEGIMEKFIRPFDLSLAPLLRVGLVKTGKAKYLLLLDMSHIITDGTSEYILERELTGLYTGEKLAPLRIQYRDFSEWQYSKKVRAYISRQEEYWLKEFAGEIPVLNLPADFQRPNIQSFEGSTYRFEIGKGETAALKKYASQEDATLFMALTAVYNIFLSKISGQEDIVIGTALAGRRHPDLEMIIGMFLNTLALRNYPIGEKSLREFLKEVKESTLKAFENQDYPFENLVEKLEMERDVTRNPLYSVMLILQRFDDPSPSFPGQASASLAIKKNVYEKNTSTNDMTLYVEEVEGKLNFSLEYCIRLFKEQTIKRYVYYIKKIVTSLANDSGEKISGIKIISKTEKQQILFEFNDTEKEIVRNKFFHRLFEEKVARHSNQVAAIYSSTQISYNKLNEDANRIAHFLVRQGIKPGTIIALYLARSIHMLASIIGVFKTGNAYLPLDKEYPAERIKYILEECDGRVLITDDVNMETVKKITGSRLQLETVLYLDHQVGMGSISGQYPVTNPGIVSPGDVIAYVIYTSGTTGKPKGAVIHQQGMINHLYAKINDLSLTPGDIIAQTASAGFDISVWQFLAGLLVGGSTFIIHKSIVLHPAGFLQVLQKGKITILESVPSLVKSFLDLTENESHKKLTHLKWMIITGEALGVHLVKAWNQRYPGILVLNAYGPTEASDDVTHYAIKESPGKNQATIPIGKPVQNIHIYILDKNLSLCGIGIRGEICVAGISVGRGYLNNPELTAEKFVKAVNSHSSFVTGGSLKTNDRSHKLSTNDCSHPTHSTLSPLHHSPIYRTGDIGYFREDGSIECLGRLDQQVKIRGNRVELGEIEQRLLNYGCIKEIVVTAISEGKAYNHLCAYYVSGKEINDSQLREYLSRGLPDYMIPSYFVPLEKIPLTSNGKIDRKALPGVEIIADRAYKAPTNYIERKLVGIWSEVLKLNSNRIGIDANFFQLGGHSLKQVAVVSKIHKELNVKIPLAEVFQKPTIKGLAKYIENSVKVRFISLESVEEKEYYELSSAQKRLYVLQQIEPASTAYNLPLMIGLEGKLDKAKLEEVFHRLTQRHESLRTSCEMVAGEVKQRVYEHVEIKVVYFEVNPEKAKETIKGFIRPFDLGHLPLLRISLLKQREDKYLMMIDMHHIITDGFSFNIFINDLLAFYQGNELPEMRFQYKDFSEWLNSLGRSGALKEQEKYWMERFKDNIPILYLPTDYPRPEVVSFQGNQIHLEIDSLLTKTVKKQTQETKTTLYIFLLAVFNVLIARYTGQEDIVIGSDNSGRMHADLENIIGFFANMLPLRNFPDGKKTFTQFLKEVKANLLEALENQQYQFEELVGKLKFTRNTGRHPLVDVVFSIEDTKEIEKETQSKFSQTGSLRLEDEGTFEFNDFEHKIAHFDLLVIAQDLGPAINMIWEYSTTLFKRSTIEKMAKRYVEILAQVVKNPGIKLNEISLSHQVLEIKSTVLKDEPQEWNLE